MPDMNLRRRKLLLKNRPAKIRPKAVNRPRFPENRAKTSRHQAPPGNEQYVLNTKFRNFTEFKKRLFRRRCLLDDHFPHREHCMLGSQADVAENVRADDPRKPQQFDFAVIED